jgi:hypothetical protein
VSEVPQAKRRSREGG